MIQLFKFKVRNDNISRFFDGHENIDEPVSNDLDFGFAHHSTALPCIFLLRTAPVFIFALQQEWVGLLLFHINLTDFTIIWGWRMLLFKNLKVDMPVYNSLFFCNKVWVKKNDTHILLHSAFNTYDYAFMHKYA